MFRPLLYARAFHGLRNLIDSPAQRAARIARLTPVGGDPFAGETVFATRATPDACDFNMHLSNSSYAMVRVCVWRGVAWRGVAWNQKTD